MAHIVFVDSGPTGLAALETAKDLGHDVTFVQARDLSTLRLTSTPAEHVAAALAHADRTVTVDTLDDDLVDEVVRIHAATPVDAVLTTSELAVLPTARAAEAIGVRGTAPDRLRRAVRKDECRDALRAAGIRSARHAAVTDLTQALLAADGIGYPLVVKPSRATAKESAAIVHSEAQLRTYFDGLRRERQARDSALEAFIGPRLVMESYLDGVLYSAEILGNGGDIRVMMLTRRERAAHNQLFEVAAVMPGGLSDAQAADVDDYLRTMFSSLGLTVGMYHVEFIMTAAGPVLVEINARMMGGMSPVVFAHVTGADPFELLIREQLGEAHEVPAPPYRTAGIVVAVGSVAGGVVPLGAVERVEQITKAYEPLRSSLRLRAGQRIARLAGNYTVLGYFCLAATSTDEARARGLELLSDLEDAVGLELAKYPTSA
ncbi:ATP-grasp domain-containing protein [Solwaraspora sp. WMMD406]|uniref:ATP-grasp domain-containing protein n=1 Tax=Solwaraspora sp. WMMD406 TaxID=3016095 RepID=UPI002417946A|nr:ATP-grasp domain-containing protein [Solwaraspora sp. WMMD406]MDG4763217.1 ATP-grasp domain-containing protein [Solwaraspora sp. WMMD406]